MRVVLYRFAKAAGQTPGRRAWNALTGLRNPTFPERLHELHGGEQDTDTTWAIAVRVCCPGFSRSGIVGCFWISLGLLFYLGGSFFINILADSFTDEEWAKYWYLNYIADTVKTLFFAVAFIIYSSNSKKTIQSKSSSVPYLDMI